MTTAYKVTVTPSKKAAEPNTIFFDGELSLFVGTTGSGTQRLTVPPVHIKDAKTKKWITILELDTADLQDNIEEWKYAWWRVLPESCLTEAAVAVEAKKVEEPLNKIKNREPSTHLVPRVRPRLT